MNKQQLKKMGLDVDSLNPSELRGAISSFMAGVLDAVPQDKKDAMHKAEATARNKAKADAEKVKLSLASEQVENVVMDVVISRLIDGKKVQVCKHELDLSNVRSGFVKDVSFDSILDGKPTREVNKHAEFFAWNVCAQNDLKSKGRGVSFETVVRFGDLGLLQARPTLKRYIALEDESDKDTTSAKGNTKANKGAKQSKLAKKTDTIQEAVTV